MPKVSVVVPLYNKGPWVEECLRSLLAQDHTDMEVIVVDDASTDNGPERVRAIAREDVRLRLLELPHNVGPGLAAQAGMDVAHGTYILRADADDVQLPGRITAQVEYLDAHPEVGALSAQMDLLGRPGERYTVPLEHEALRVELLFGVALFQPVMALRRSVLVEHGIRYRAEWPRFGEDWLLQLELARVTRLANLPEARVQYRVGPQNSARGRDRHADLCQLYRAAFHAHDLPITNEELELHLYVARHFHRPLEAASVLAFKAWMERLVGLCRAHTTLDAALLEARCSKAWDDLFPHVVDRGLVTTWAYLRQGARMDVRRWYYLIATLLKGAPLKPRP